MFFLDSLVITEPPVLNVTLDSIKTRPITCPGSDDGQVGVKVAGGNAGAIVHTWTPNYPDTNFIRGVVPGVYAVIVSDSKGCKDTLNNITMAAPPDITANLAINFMPRCAEIRPMFSLLQSVEAMAPAILTPSIMAAVYL
ncbi:MAG: hypothetical protein IPF93_12950 [Saprospiraceae bacterium]|nr:hypothetical protein [Saprospiraceae bacterium]